MKIETLEFHQKVHETDFRFEVQYYKMMYRGLCYRMPTSLTVFDYQYFVTWDEARRAAAVDIGAPIWYIKLASLCEFIDRQSLYTELLPEKLPPLGNPDRRIAVETFILDLAGRNYRRAYIHGRRIMYAGLLATGICLIAEEPLLQRMSEWFNNIPESAL